MLNFLTCISTTFSKQAVKALARLCVCAWADSEGGHGVWTQTVRMRMGGFGGGTWVLDPPPLKNHKTIGFSSNLQKKSQGYQASIKCWAIIGTTVSPSTKKKKKTKKKRCQSRTPSGKTFWIRAKCANSSEPSLRSDL